MSVDKLVLVLRAGNTGRKGGQYGNKNAQKDLEDKAIKQFGLTNNPDEAGYVLSDGRMLDFSGRHQLSEQYQRIDNHNIPRSGPDDLYGKRSIDHRAVNTITGREYGTLDMAQFMHDAKAMRVNINGTSITAGVASDISPAQKQFIGHFPIDETAFDVMDTKGDTNYYIEPRLRRELMRAFEVAHNIHSEKQ